MNDEQNPFTINNKEVQNGKAQSVQRDRKTVRSSGHLVRTAGDRHHSRLSLSHVEFDVRMVGLHRNDVGLPVLRHHDDYRYHQHNLQGEEVDRMVEGTRQSNRREVR